MNIDFRYQSIDIDKEKSCDFDYYLLQNPYAKIWQRSGGLFDTFLYFITEYHLISYTWM